MIRMTSVSLLPMDSKFCHGNNNNVSSCDVLDYSKTLKTNCNGRSNCTVKRNGMNSRHRECKKVFIISVLFDCGECFQSLNPGFQFSPFKLFFTCVNLLFQLLAIFVPIHFTCINQWRNGGSRAPMNQVPWGS